MCDIAGIIYYDRARPVAVDDLKRMCRTLIHRGPDDEGFFVKGNVGLGMRRLQVIDLVTGHQPISNEDGSVWIVFNGEIYNYAEIRRDRVFQRKATSSLLIRIRKQLFTPMKNSERIAWKKLNGMFAFAIWDGRSEKLFLARARIGAVYLHAVLGSERPADECWLWCHPLIFSNYDL